MNRPASIHRSKSPKFLATIMLLLVAVILSGCRPPTKIRTLLGENPKNIPCWRGICPGQQVSPQKVIDILETVSGVTGPVYDQSHRLLSFRWDDIETCDDICSYCQGKGIVGFITDGIEYISLDLSYAITLGELVDYLGTPECVFVLGSKPDWYAALVVNDRLGYSAWLNPLSGPNDRSITREMTLDTVSLYKTDINSGCTDINQLKAYSWRGFNVVYP